MYKQFASEESDLAASAKNIRHIRKFEKRSASSLETDAVPARVNVIMRARDSC